MWRDRQAEALVQEIEAVISSLSRTVALTELVREPLRSRGRGLYRKGNDLWPLLPVLVCEAVCGRFEHALPVAAARQFLVAAADVFDDIEDADSPESLSVKYGSAVATNVATTLLILAEKAIPRLATRGITDNVIVRAMDILNSAYVTACAGQHLDLSLKPQEISSEDVYLSIAAMKSASQTECTCRLGALLGGANEELIGKLSEFGYNLGMASQITNDIQGVTGGTDIVTPKITLPVIYALNQSDEETRELLLGIFTRPRESPVDSAQLADIIFRSGAMHYAMVRMESYRQHAGDALCKVQEAGANVERLKLILK